jgi:hypothetical protein
LQVGKRRHSGRHPRHHQTDRADAGATTRNGLIMAVGVACSQREHCPNRLGDLRVV